MPYPETMIYGMRAELANLGIEEAKTTEAVDEAVKNTDGTLMVVVNSVCGCAAGGVRPGIAMALANSPNKPDRSITVFAGADIDATETAREYFTGHTEDQDLGSEGEVLAEAGFPQAMRAEVVEGHWTCESGGER